MAAAASRKPAARSGWDVDDYLSYLLARASHVVASEFHREVRAAGLTVLEWRVLATLSDGRARPVGDVAAIVLGQQSTVTKLLDRMAAEGRVERAVADADRRRTLVAITARGRAALGRLLSRSKRHERGTVARLSARETSALKSALKKLIDAPERQTRRISRASQPRRLG